MPKNRNSGGCGSRDSTQSHFTRNRTKYYNSSQENIILAEGHLAEYLTGSHIECLECGRHFKNLSTHLYFSHTLTKDDYCKKHGLPCGTPLVSEYTREKQSISAKRKLVDNPDLLTMCQSTMAKGRQALKKAKHAIVDAICPDCNKPVSTNSRMFALRRGKMRCQSCVKKATAQAGLKHFRKSAKARQFTCHLCAKEFNTKTYNTHKKDKEGIPVFCSASCGSKYHSAFRTKSYSKICPSCKVEFTRKRNDATFCSISCYRKSESCSNNAKKNGQLGGSKRALAGNRDDKGRFIIQ